MKFNLKWDVSRIHTESHAHTHTYTHRNDTRNVKLECHVATRNNPHISLSNLHLNFYQFGRHSFLLVSNELCISQYPHTLPKALIFFNWKLLLFCYQIFGRSGRYLIACSIARRCHLERAFSPVHSKRFIRNGYSRWKICMKRSKTSSSHSEVTFIFFFLFDSKMFAAISLLSASKLNKRHSREKSIQQTKEKYFQRFLFFYWSWKFNDEWKCYKKSTTKKCVWFASNRTMLSDI